MDAHALAQPDPGDQGDAGDQFAAGIEAAVLADHAAGTDDAVLADDAARADGHERADVGTGSHPCVRIDDRTGVDARRAGRRDVEQRGDLGECGVGVLATSAAPGRPRHRRHAAPPAKPGCRPAGRGSADWRGRSAGQDRRGRGWPRHGWQWRGRHGPAGRTARRVAGRCRWEYSRREFNVWRHFGHGAYAANGRAPRGRQSQCHGLGRTGRDCGGGASTSM